MSNEENKKVETHTGFRIIAIVMFLVALSCLAVYTGTFKEYCHLDDARTVLISRSDLEFDYKGGTVTMNAQSYEDYVEDINGITDTIGYRANRFAAGLFWFAFPLSLACFIGFTWANWDNDKRSSSSSSSSYGSRW